MTGDGSAYATLGIDPDADSATIERTYRRLIKQHHPDREGGDGSRAAEINRAYRELRRERHLKDPLELYQEPISSRQGKGWVAVALLLALASVGLLATQTSLPIGASFIPAKASIRGGSQPASVRHDPMDAPLNVAEIDSAATNALTISRKRDEMALAAASRECHHSLRSSPSIALLDRCAAFDDAVVQLQDRDPLRDQGPFSELAVTGRLWSGASALSDDSVAIDGRLDRIRLRVELSLAPRMENGGS